MNIQKFLSKLKSQKGVTGVDIVVSITVITLTIVVVTAIYTNIDLTSKNVNRTAGATRIATNILEEIEKMYYDEFKEEISEIEKDFNKSGKEYIVEVSSDTNDTKKIIINPKKVSKTVKFFNTKIPKGYLVEMKLQNSYGTDTGKKYDMVRKIDLSVKYNVGETEEKVSLSTAKTLELCEVCNEPEISRETFALYPNVNPNTVIPIKRVGNSYKIINETEDKNDYIGWYSYENKLWAAIIVGSLDYDETTGILKDGFEKNMYVWIPNYGRDNNGKFVFRYKNTDNIIKNELLTKAGESKSIYTMSKQTAKDLEDCEFEVSGYWIKYTDLNDNRKEGYEYIKQLNDSKEYGPFEI
jgi:hypothetical protein